MSMITRRKEELFPRKSVVETDLDRIVNELFPKPLPPLPKTPEHRIQKMITLGDGSYTNVEYSITGNPETGEQKVGVSISTAKSECERCGRLASRLKTCEHCGREVCGFCIHSRAYGTFICCMSCINW
jgi:hypothetical protein